MNKCNVENCDQEAKLKQMCRRHYFRQIRGRKLEGPSSRDPRPHVVIDGIIHIPLGIEAKMGYCIVDEELSYLDKHQWILNPSGYAVTSISGKTKFMHKMILEGEETDHINGDRLDNRRSNLRPANQSQNRFNSRVKKDSTNGYKGVYRNNSVYWGARIQKDGKRLYLGNFPTKEDAARAYDEKAKELFGEYAWLNFPNEK